MRLNTHLSFNGNCQEAFEFYEKCLGGRISFLMKYGESPMAAQFPGLESKVMHGTLTLGDQVLTGADAPLASYVLPQGFSVLLSMDSAAEADRIFPLLANQGTVQMPLQETFWTPRFGMVIDRFGIPWMINCGA